MLTLYFLTNKNRVKQILILFIILFTQGIGNIIFAQSWSQVGSGTNAGIYASIVYKGELYVGGNFTLAGGKNANYVAKWDGSKWSTVGGGFDGIVQSFAIYDDELYAGGGFKRADGKPAHRIAKWNGSNWSPVGAGMDSTSSYVVYSMKVFKGYLYAAGGFNNVIGVPNTQRIAKWDNKKWVGVGGGMDNAIGSLEVFNNTLIALGPFLKAGNTSVKYVAQWNDTAWKNFGNGFNTITQSTLKVINNQLYACGDFGMADGKNAKRIAIWNGKEWSEFGGGMDNAVAALEEYNNEIYAGGTFKLAGSTSVNYIAKWNGKTWIDIGGGMDNSVTNLIVYNNELYAAGIFNKAGKTSVGFIAKWNPTASITTEIESSEINVFPNPSMGSFNFVVSKRWTNSHLDIFDIYGRNVFQTKISNKNNHLELASEHKGIFYYSLTAPAGIVFHGKIKIN